VTPAMTPTAVGRSCWLNSTVRTENAITISPAPPSPISTRAAMNSATDVEYAHAADPIPKSPKEMRRTFLRPYRSPRRPAGSIAAARTRKYPDENH
jgi:hypothetical protein